ncbi:MAG TPA: hypothetical protein DCM08_01165 [Microscillaceae bacterium]|jgi:hypothetical protein|nr:hypothetical protein [Microscillaceae bacterium]
MTQISKDTLWKGIIEDLFDDFLHYFFPEWAAQTVDFSQKFVFLDKELDEIAPKPQGNQKRYADKLVKVFTQTGQEQWVLVHVEVQGYADSLFAERMFTYFYRIKDRWQKDVLAIALLTDDNPDFHPKSYTYEYHQTRYHYEFATFKLLEKTERELNIAGNPFSVVMLAAHKALSQSNLTDEKQLVWKMDLVRSLKQAQYSGEKIRNILNFIRYYSKFKQVDTLALLDKQIQTTLNQRKPMGIEEAILQEVKEQAAKRAAKQAAKQAELQTKVKGIQMALKQNILSLEQIAELFEVTLDFVKKVQSGELK